MKTSNELTKKIPATIKRLIPLHTFIIATIDTSIPNKYYFAPTKAPYIKYIQHSNISPLIEQELNHKFDSEEALCRIHISTTDKLTCILFTFNHAIADAGSAFQCAADLITLYQGKQKTFHNPNTLSFPSPIENFLPTNLIPNSIPYLEKIKSNKGKYKHKLYTTITNSSLFLSKNLQKYKTTSFAAIMSALALKAYTAIICKQNLTRYLNIDLRTILCIEKRALAFYSVGIPEVYCNVGKTCIVDLVKKLELNMYKSITSKDFLAKGLAHDFPHPHTAGISYIRNPALLELEQTTIVENAQIFGNCFYEETIEHKIFLLLTRFRNKFNISLHYDTRNFSDLAANKLMKVFLHMLKTKL